MTKKEKIPMGKIGIDQERFKGAVTKAENAVSRIEKVPSPNITKNNLSRFTSFHNLVEKAGTTLEAFKGVSSADTGKMKAVADKIVDEDAKMANVMKQNTARFE
ncbi:TIGR04197 family type VII secretion effector [Bacillus cereus group sp. BfR-BA-01315]|uniref:TIGR04197 family type VII secretion effector n=1 Tax=Bacillus cereus group sp. BfR-BA-01315 TaxID=2920292 RepID=UPI001F5788B3|nr:TIGR04197 family type VII secretion effector [Bacillus cereus group sp. BfR-BA-01315]